MTPPHPLVTTALSLFNRTICFQRPPTAFRVGHKLEVVDKRNPSLIRVGTISAIDGFKVKISFDGWDEIYDDWFDSDSSDLHPRGWCEKSGYPLEAPISKSESKYSTLGQMKVRVDHRLLYTLIQILMRVDESFRYVRGNSRSTLINSHQLS
jgi:hypothetical protein